MKPLLASLYCICIVLAYATSWLNVIHATFRRSFSKRLILTAVVWECYEIAPPSVQV